MKKIIFILVFVLLGTSVYIGALSAVTGERMTPPSLDYILTEITSFEYYVNVNDTLKDIEYLWTTEGDTYADVGGGEDGSGDGRILPDWLIDLNAWFYESEVGRVFLTIGLTVELVAYSVYDTLLALYYVLRVLSVFLTGVPA